jgi:DNA-3-methyladenine glycosylase II
VLAGLVDAHRDFDPRSWLAELPAMDLFGAIVFQVAGQQLSVQSTRRILERLSAMFGGRLPSAAELVAVDADTLRSSGLSRRKIATLRDVAERINDGRVRESALRRLSDEEVQAVLTEIPGIGPWTVHGVLIIAFDRQDVVLSGDLALRKVIRHAYGLDHLPSAEEVERIAAPWRPYRTLATSYLFAWGFEDSS